MNFSDAMIERAARALAVKIDCNEERWRLYRHPAQLALEAALAPLAEATLGYTTDDDGVWVHMPSGRRCLGFFPTVADAIEVAGESA